MTPKNTITHKIKEYYFNLGKVFTHPILLLKADILLTRITIKNRDFFFLYKIA